MSDETSNSRCCVQSTRGDLRMVRISGANSAVEIANQGAHICHWQIHERKPVFFMSPNSLFTPGKAVRGGVPVIFPWFGKKEGDAGAAQHGFARTANWALTRSEVDINGIAIAEFELHDSDSTRAAWPYSFVARLIAAAAMDLRITLEITNTDSKPFTFGAALHSYFSISDIHRIRILGLENSRFIDQVADNEIRVQPDEPITFDGEIDRIYTETTTTCVIDDPEWKRRIIVAKSGSSSTVVWNPWTKKARSMSDLGDPAWNGMVCIETANAGPDTVSLKPGAVHRLEALISVDETSD